MHESAVFCAFRRFFLCAPTRCFAAHPLLPGIPIIHNMQGSYVGDSIESVMGIMNGTTNFMLTKMEMEGADYATVLKEAQDLGFAEGAREALLLCSGLGIHYDSAMPCLYSWRLRAMWCNRCL